MTVRFQASRARGWRKPVDGRLVARPSRWGNPFTVGGLIMADDWRLEGMPGFVSDLVENGMLFVRDRQMAVALYREWVALSPGVVDAARAELVGRPLGCWCPLDEPCHVDVLLEVANSTGPWPPVT